MAPRRFDAVEAMRKMEKFTREVGGYPFLYADIFMSRKEFEQMFDLTGASPAEVTSDSIEVNEFSFPFPAYEQVRKKYGAEGAFPHLYDKVRPEIDVFKVGQEFADPL